jgi:hypothetical protein
MNTENQIPSIEKPSNQSGFIDDKTEIKKEFQKVVWDDLTACCNNQDIYSHGNREWCKSCGHVFNH